MIKPKKEAILKEVWEYYYCRNCRKIVYNTNSALGNKVDRCAACGKYDLEAPGWVFCPHQKGLAVLCPRRGKGIKKKKIEVECEDRCNFRII